MQRVNRLFVLLAICSLALAQEDKEEGDKNEGNTRLFGGHNTGGFVPNAGGHVSGAVPGRPFGQAGVVPGRPFGQAGVVPGRPFGQAGVVPGSPFGQAGVVPGRPFGQAGVVPGQVVVVPGQVGAVPGTPIGQVGSVFPGGQAGGIFPGGQVAPVSGVIPGCPSVPPPTPPCKFYKKHPCGHFVCDVDQKVFECPVLRPECPSTRFHTQPQFCTNDNFCRGSDKCCPDICFPGRYLCKPAH